MWKAKITEVSEIDLSGRLEIRFDVFKGSTLRYTGILLSVDPSVYEREVKKKLRELKDANDTKDTITVGTEITL